MDILFSIIKMLGGLSLLIYGMKVLSTELKKISGGKLEKILTNFTDKPFKGLIVGFLITVATQSSSTTTVIVVSLVNSGILSLTASIPIIMGANVGTTINSQILRFSNIEGSSFLSFISPTNLAPLILLIGLVIIERGKKQKAKDIGQMLFGLGLLFTGMITMLSAANTFSNLPILGTILNKLSNPILGVIAGALVTAIVQSSAATIGILQAISNTGIVTYASTIPIILGQNIGTCFTSILASSGGSKNAKRVAAVHLYFNLIGTIMFLVAIYLYQYLIGFSFWNNPIDMGGIANFHTIFNVLSTVILFPFIKLIEKLTLLTIRENKNIEDDDSKDDEYIESLNKLDERIATIPSVAIANTTYVIEKMGELSEKNFVKSMAILNVFDEKKYNRIEEREAIIDKMEGKVTKYLVKLGTRNITDYENTSISALMRIQSEFEKIGDYSFKFAKIIKQLEENHIKISEDAIKELNNAYKITDEIVLKTINLFKNRDVSNYIEIEALRETSEFIREKYKLAHIQRLKEGKCNVEAGIIYLEILALFEKISYHCLNVSIAISNFVNNKKFTTKYDFTQEIYKNSSIILKEKIDEYMVKYN